MGRRREAHERPGHHAGAHRGVLLVTHRAALRPALLGLARPCGRNPGAGAPADRHVHADRHATEVAGRPPSRHAGGGGGWSHAGVRLQAALRLLERRIPRGSASNHHAVRRALWIASGRDRLADRQRIRLPRHGRQLLAGRGAQVPPLARGALRHHRVAQRALGQRVLEHGISVLLRDRCAGGHGHRGQSASPARLQAIRQRRGGALQPHAVRDPARALARARDRAQLHAVLHRVRPLRRGGRPGRRHLG